jgi:hypothetical protein
VGDWPHVVDVPKDTDPDIGYRQTWYSAALIDDVHTIPVYYGGRRINMYYLSTLVLVKLAAGCQGFSGLHHVHRTGMVEAGSRGITPTRPDPTRSESGEINIYTEERCVL